MTSALRVPSSHELVTSSIALSANGGHSGDLCIWHKPSGSSEPAARLVSSLSRPPPSHNRVAGTMFDQSAKRAAIAPETTFRIVDVGKARLEKSTLTAFLLKVQDFGAELEINKKNQGWQPAEELPCGDSTLKMRWYKGHFTEMVDGVSVRTCFEIVDTPGFAS